MKDPIFDHQRLELYCQSVEDEPEALLGIARLKMSGHIADGRIDDYVTFESDYNRLQRSTQESIGFVLALGWPRLPGIHFHIQVRGRTLGALTISCPANIVARWRPAWLYWFLCRECELAEVEARPDPRFVYALWARLAYNGAVVQNVPVKAAPAYSKEEVEYRRIECESASRIVWLESYEPSPLPDKKYVLEQTVKRVEGVAVAEGFYRVVESEVDEFLTSLPMVATPRRCAGALAMSYQPLSGDLFPSLSVESTNYLLLLCWHLIGRHEAGATQDQIASGLPWPVSSEDLESLLGVLRQRRILNRVSSGDGVVWRVADSVVHLGWSGVETGHSNNAMRAALGNAHEVCKKPPEDGFHAECLLVPWSESKQSELRALTIEAVDKIAAIPRSNEAGLAVYQNLVGFVPLLRPDGQDSLSGLDADLDWMKRSCVQLARLDGVRIDAEWLSRRVWPRSDVRAWERCISLAVKEGFLVDDGQQLGWQAANEAKDFRKPGQASYEHISNFMLEVARREASIGHLAAYLQFVDLSSGSLDGVRDILSAYIESVSRISEEMKYPDQVYQVWVQTYPVI